MPSATLSCKVRFAWKINVYTMWVAHSVLCAKWIHTANVFKTSWTTVYHQAWAASVWRCILIRSANGSYHVRRNMIAPPSSQQWELLYILVRWYQYWNGPRVVSTIIMIQQIFLPGGRESSGINLNFIRNSVTNMGWLLISQWMRYTLLGLWTLNVFCEFGKKICLSGMFYSWVNQWLCGKLWYLQHNCVGDTIVYLYH